MQTINSGNTVETKSELKRSTTATCLSLPAMFLLFQQKHCWLVVPCWEGLEWFSCSSLDVCEALCDIACDEGYANTFDLITRELRGHCLCTYSDKWLVKEAILDSEAVAVPIRVSCEIICVDVTVFSLGRWLGQTVIMVSKLPQSKQSVCFWVTIMTHYLYICVCVICHRIHDTMETTNVLVTFCMALHWCCHGSVHVRGYINIPHVRGRSQAIWAQNGLNCSVALHKQINTNMDYASLVIRCVCVCVCVCVCLSVCVYVNHSFKLFFFKLSFKKKHMHVSHYSPYTHTHTRTHAHTHTQLVS